MAGDDHAIPTQKPHALAWLPNALTMSRVALSPLILLSLIVPAFAYGVSWESWLILTPGTWPAAALLVLSAILDWLDGRLARALRAESAFGRFWDPVADKLVVGAALVGGMLAVPSMLFIAPAAALLWRDAVITWMRTRPRYAAATAAPSVLAKWKTALEYAALITLFSATTIGVSLPQVLKPIFYLPNFPIIVGLVTLWVAAALSVWTGWSYIRRARAISTGASSP